jgi:hypothetical protein
MLVAAPLCLLHPPPPWGYPHLAIPNPGQLTWFGTNWYAYSVPAAAGSKGLYRVNSPPVLQEHTSQQHASSETTF